MASGLVFDIAEFTVHDGPGIRTTVFLKGCPLRCAWCHNPEGLTFEPQRVAGAGGERVAGQRWEAAALAERLNRQGDLLRGGGGGVTFSGGEPLAQAAFVAEVTGLLDRIHVVLDTSGFAPPDDFELVARRCDLVYFDLKLLDPAAHRRWTGVDNAPIVANLARLTELGVPYVIRVPLVPTVTDSPANLAAIAAHVAGLAGLVRVDLLPYNRAAGGKYRACGLAFQPGYDEDEPIRADPAPFEAYGIPVRVA